MLHLISVQGEGQRRRLFTEISTFAFKPLFLALGIKIEPSISKVRQTLIPAVLWMYTVVLASESVDEILKCDHSNESY